MKITDERLKTLRDEYIPKSWFPSLEECETMIRELIVLRRHKELSDAVIEACEYNRKELPERLKEKIDHWFKFYKIDEEL